MPSVSFSSRPFSQKLKLPEAAFVGKQPWRKIEPKNVSVEKMTNIRYGDVFVALYAIDVDRENLNYAHGSKRKDSAVKGQC